MFVVCVCVRLPFRLHCEGFQWIPICVTQRMTHAVVILWLTHASFMRQLTYTGVNKRLTHAAVIR